MKRHPLILLCVLFTLSTAHTRAADGRIPISGPTAITTPGSYYLTQDYTNSAGSPAMLIMASNVTLDLGGHTITQSVASPVISINGTSDQVDIRNGRLVGGNQAIFFSYTGTTLGNIRLSRLTALNQTLYGFRLNGNATASLRAIVEDCVVQINPAANSCTAAIYSTYGQGGWFVRNTLSGCTGGTASNGMELLFDTGLRIEDNLIENSSGTAIDILSTSSQIRLTNNLLRGNAWGIYVGGASNALEWNTIVGNTNYAISIQGTNNIYSNNHTKANGSGISNLGGASNIDAGGNF